MNYSMSGLTGYTGTPQVGSDRENSQSYALAGFGAAGPNQQYTSIRNQVLQDIEKENQATHSLWVNPKGGKASDILSKLTRAQWQDYKDRFQPIESALMNQTTYNNPDLVKNSIATGMNTVNNAYDSAISARGNMLSRYGVNQRADEQAAASRSSQINRSTALVDTANRIRMRLEDRNREIALGSTPNAGRAYGLSSSK